MRRALAIAAAVTLLPVTLAAQAGSPRGGGMFVPDSLRNLRVLPRAMTPTDVVGVMRNVTGALGVRCQYCHIGEEGQPLSQFDFASDDKPTKVAARRMMEMVQAINGQYLAGLDRRQALQVNPNDQGARARLGELGGPLP